MRDSSNLIQPEYKTEKLQVLNISQVPLFTMEPYDLDDEKDFKKYIQNLERVCRSSIEYQEYIQYLRKSAGMNHCSFYENVNNIDYNKVKIHIHHEPLTLYDICIAVINKRRATGESLHTNMVAKEVMYCHYKLWVGLIPLSETVHELVHNQYIIVYPDKVFGNYKQFIEYYKPYIDPDIIYRIENLEEESKHTDSMGVAKQILNKNLVYVNVDEFGKTDYTQLRSKLQDVIKEKTNG